MSFWSKPIPIIFWMRNPEPQSLMVIRTTAADQTQLLSQLKSEWEQLVPFIPFSGFEQVKIDEEAQDVNKNITAINMFLAIIAIVLSSIALYTLVSLNILKRIKEIGVRTVLGSSKIEINWLISKPFIIIVVLASVVGGLGGYSLSSLLLNSLWPVRIPIGIGSIVIPVLAVVALAYLIMSIKILRTTLKNPVESLRYE
jgi:ABC-type antimicrobial peptide transport system permease subunit